MTIIKSLLKASGDQYASIVSDGIVGNKNTYTIDTGSYALNALISSSIYKGLPSNKRLAFAAPSSTGKTFFSLQLLKNFQEENPTGIAFYFDTEKAVDEHMLISRGIDPARVVVSQPSTVEEFRTYGYKILDEYEKHVNVDSDDESDNKMMIFLDSLGMLSSEAELNTIASGDNKADMGKTQKLLKGTFRALALRTARMNIPWCVVGHTYANLGGFGDSIGGGCLEEGTLIRTPNGLKAIEDFKVGDDITTKDGTGIVTNTWDEETLIDPNPECFEVEFSDGSKVIMSEEHKIMVDGEMIEIGKIVNNYEHIIINTEGDHSIRNSDR